MDPRDRFAESELSGELQDALNGLEESFRVAVVLSDVLGCSYAEIAELTDVPEGTVKSRIFRARSELAERLGTTRTGTESKE
jgi:RNA polymerase sigma-70 factor, ECF subfamily